MCLGPRSVRPTLFCVCVWLAGWLSPFPLLCISLLPRVQQLQQQHAVTAAYAAPLRSPDRPPAMDRRDRCDSGTVCLFQHGFSFLLLDGTLPKRVQMSACAYLHASPGTWSYLGYMSDGKPSYPTCMLGTLVPTLGR